jgi:hypothetical protein
MGSAMLDLRRTALLLSLASFACAGDDPDDDTSADSSSSAPATDPTTSTDPATTDPGTSESTSTAADTTTGGLCVTELPAIVTDIDETLTLSDAEFVMQLGDSTYDPIEREGAAEMITAYADLGYQIMYLTARAESLSAEDSGETSRELTERWLMEHDFPLDDASTIVVLSPNLVVGESARMYKAEAIATQQAAGWRFDYAYGNATSDIDAYADAGIPLDVTFIIGEHAGEGGTVAVEGEGWVEHTADVLPTVPNACEG